MTCDHVKESTPRVGTEGIDAGATTARKFECGEERSDQVRLWPVLPGINMLNHTHG